MRHKTYRKLLHLNRPGELSPRRAKKLERHLHRCQLCAKEKLKIDKAHRLTAIARDTAPQPSNPQELTGRIMEAIAEQRAANLIRVPSPAGKTGYKWLDRLYSPKIRFAMAAIALAVLGIFVIQSSLILHRISRLEQQMTAQVKEETRFSYDTILTKKMTRTAAVRTLEDADRIPDDIAEDWVIISKSTLKSLLQALKKNKWQKDEENLVNRLRKELFLFNNIYFADGIEKREMKKILEKKKEILQLIYKL